jgi:hypothetical protein
MIHKVVHAPKFSGIKIYKNSEKPRTYALFITNSGGRRGVGNDVTHFEPQLTLLKKENTPLHWVFTSGQMNPNSDIRITVPVENLSPASATGLLPIVEKALERLKGKPDSERQSDKPVYEQFKDILTKIKHRDD